MPPLVDVTGRAFGRLIVLERFGNEYNKGGAKWRARCECGTIVVVLGMHLRTGHTRSCGCLDRDTKRRHGAAHPGQQTVEYHAWQSAKQRCERPSHKNFPNYGGRGIYMCAEWRDSFETFFRDRGPRPRGTSLDRIDNNGPYSPENCRWATPEQQQRNRRTNRFVDVKGQRMTVAEAIRRLGLTRNVYLKIYRGMTPEQALGL